MMKLDKVTKQKINDLKILEVADKLQLKYSSTGTWRKALCFCHNDHTPSLGLNTTTNRWKCFVCGDGGSPIDLVMKKENLQYSAACEWLINEFHIPVPQQENRRSLINAIKDKLMNYNNDNVDANVNQGSINHKPYALNRSLLERFKGTSNEFTRAIVQTGILTQEQMNHACEVFRLSTADDNVIFWQIDRDNHIREGKVMYYQADAHRSHSRKPVTVSWLLKEQGQLDKEWKAKSCLFGLHQIKDKDERSIAIVESEKTAIICSELLASENFIWLATGGKSNLIPQSLQPLKGKKIIIFPDTDPTGTTYQDWLQIAKDTAKQFGHPLTVSNLLELHATPDQKSRKIDIADFILESNPLTF